MSGLLSSTKMGFIYEPTIKASRALHDQLGLRSVAPLPRKLDSFELAKALVTKPVEESWTYVEVHENESGWATSPQSSWTIAEEEEVDDNASSNDGVSSLYSNESQPTEAQDVLEAEYESVDKHPTLTGDEKSAVKDFNEIVQVHDTTPPDENFALIETTSQFSNLYGSANEADASVEVPVPPPSPGKRSLSVKTRSDNRTASTQGPSETVACGGSQQLDSRQEGDQPARYKILGQHGIPDISRLRLTQASQEQALLTPPNKRASLLSSPYSAGSSAKPTSIATNDYTPASLAEAPTPSTWPQDQAYTNMLTPTSNAFSEGKKNHHNLLGMLDDHLSKGEMPAQHTANMHRMRFDLATNTAASQQTSILRSPFTGTKQSSYANTSAFIDAGSRGANSPSPGAVLHSYGPPSGSELSPRPNGDKIATPKQKSRCDSATPRAEQQVVITSRKARDLPPMSFPAALFDAAVKDRVSQIQAQGLRPVMGPWSPAAIITGEGITSKVPLLQERPPFERQKQGLQQSPPTYWYDDLANDLNYWIASEDTICRVLMVSNILSTPRSSGFLGQDRHFGASCGDEADEIRYYDITLPPRSRGIFLSASPLRWIAVEIRFKTGGQALMTFPHECIEFGRQYKNHVFMRFVRTQRVPAVSGDKVSEEFWDKFIKAYSEGDVQMSLILKEAGTIF